MTTRLKQSRIKANQKWDKEHMATVAARVKVEKAEQYKEHARKQGKSLNALIIELLERNIKENGG